MVVLCHFPPAALLGDSERHRSCLHQRMAITSYRDLDVWQISMDLVDLVFAHTQTMPRVEFDLRRQIRRAAVSIPSNIAEGWRRKDRRQAYQNHVSIAMGSHGELETELEICFRNGLLLREEAIKALELMRRVGPMLDRLYDSVDRMLVEGDRVWPSRLKRIAELSLDLERRSVVERRTGS